MKFCCVISEELRWQTVAEVYWSKLVQRGVTPRKKIESFFPVDMHIYIVCPYYVKRFYEILLCGLRGPASCDDKKQDWRTDGQTDGSKTLYPAQLCCVGYKNIMCLRLKYQQIHFQHPRICIVRLTIQILATSNGFSVKRHYNSRQWKHDLGQCQTRI